MGEGAEDLEEKVHSLHNYLCNCYFSYLLTLHPISLLLLGKRLPKIQTDLFAVPCFSQSGKYEEPLHDVVGLMACQNEQVPMGEGGWNLAQHKACPQRHSVNVPNPHHYHQ